MKWFSIAAAFSIALNINASVAPKTDKTITGQVRATGDQQPVQGVTVRVKGTSNVSGSQEDGIYYIVIHPADSVLVFTHPDYVTKEIHLTHENEYNVELSQRHP